VDEQCAATADTSTTADARSTTDTGGAQLLDLIGSTNGAVLLLCGGVVEERRISCK
jgi:hypothetical protein